MRRDLRIALLSAGVVLGFGAGVHALRMRAWQHQLAWERHFAASCVEAARGSATPSATLPPPGFPGGPPARW